MASNLLLTTTARLDPQVVHDTLATREAMEAVHSWISDYLDATVSIRSWTPYWKEVTLHRPGNISLTMRFRLGGPVETSQSRGWSLSEGERRELEGALLPFLSNTGSIMTQERVADAVQEHYTDATRDARSDRTIVLRFMPPPSTAPLDDGPQPPVEMAVIVRPDQAIQVFARGTDEASCRSAIRRFLANLQVAGFAIEENSPIALRR
jgi:uncharacterized protein YcbX